MTLRLPIVLPWHPAAAVAIVGLAVIGTTPRVGGDPMLRLRLVGAAMAAATACVLDDSAAATLASSPTTLMERRAVQLSVVVPAVALWWLGSVALLSARRTAPLPLTSTLPLELAMYTAVGLAACVWSQRRSDDRSGGVAGAVAVTVLFASSMLPATTWWPLAATGADPSTIPLQLVLVAAFAGLIAGSLDPSGVRRH